MIKGGDLILDSGDSSRQCVSSIFISLLTIIIAISYKIGMDNVYIISFPSIVDSIKNRLYYEGYYIEQRWKGVYIIYPVLYGERD